MVQLGELIACARMKGGPSVTVIEDIGAEALAEIMTVAGRLWLTVVGIKDDAKEGGRIAILRDREVAMHLARKLQKRCQVMYDTLVRRPKGSIAIAGLTSGVAGWDVMQDDGFVMHGYDAQGNEIPPFLVTDGEAHAHCDIATVSPGLNEAKLLRYAKRYFVREGIYHEAWQCYCPAGDSLQEVADRRKMEKLLQKTARRRLPVMP